MPKMLVVSAHNVLEDPRIYYKLVLSLKKEFSDVTYMVKSIKKKSFIKDSVRIEPLPIFKSIILRALILHWIILWKTVRGKYEIVQFNSPELIFVGFILKNIFRKKIVFDVHENFTAEFVDKMWIPPLFRKILTFTYPRMEKFLTKNYDLVIIAETSYRKIYGERAVEIFNFPIFPKEKIIPKQFTDRMDFAYVGGIMEDRCIFELLETFKIIQHEKTHAKLHLVGYFAPENLEQRVLKYIEENNLTNNIVLYGRVSILKVYDVLKNTDFGFSLMRPIGNFIESLSTKIFDYMIWGVPFAVSDFKIYKEFVVDANTGIVVDQTKPAEIAEMVLKLINDQDRLIEMSKNGQQLVLEKWNWLTQEEKLINCYKKIIQN